MRSKRNSRAAAGSSVPTTTFCMPSGQSVRREVISVWSSAPLGRSRSRLAGSSALSTMSSHLRARLEAVLDTCRLLRIGEPRRPLLGKYRFEQRGVLRVQTPGLPRVHPEERRVGAPELLRVLPREGRLADAAHAGEDTTRPLVRSALGAPCRPAWISISAAARPVKVLLGRCGRASTRAALCGGALATIICTLLASCCQSAPDAPSAKSMNPAWCSCSAAGATSSKLPSNSGGIRSRRRTSRTASTGTATAA